MASEVTKEDKWYWCKNCSNFRIDIKKAQVTFYNFGKMFVVQASQ